MLDNVKKAISLLILLIGLAVLVRSVLAAGTLSLTTGVVAGVAFAAFGAVRLYYYRGKP